MKSQKSQPEFRQSLHGVPYDNTTAGEPPIPIKSSNSPHRVDSNDSTPVQAPTYVSAKAKVQKDADWAQTSSSFRGSSTSVNTETQSFSSRTSAPSVPQIRIDQDPTPIQDTERSRPSLKTKKPVKGSKYKSSTVPELSLDLPSGALSDELAVEAITFTKRGSMLIEGRKVSGAASTRSRAAGNINRKVLSAEEESLSERVRSFYDTGAEVTEVGDGSSSFGRQIGLRWQSSLQGLDSRSANSVSRTTSATDLHSIPSIKTNDKDKRESMVVREENELAGGLEDWQDIENGDVDRYGFIVPQQSLPKPPRVDGISVKSSPRDVPTLQRVTSSLQQAAEAPRRRTTMKKSPTNKSNHRRSASGHGGPKALGEDLRPDSSQRPHTATVVRRESTLRQATNRLPHNRSRRLRDEASDIFTLPPASNGQQGNTQLEPNGRSRRKEREREDKWRNMAKLVSSQSGGGMIFGFDTADQKLIDRTWKGIPDRWRATAWYAFLSASAKKKPSTLNDHDLVSLFHDYMSQSCPDDVQIDIDVPRTISNHIMFRRRYRGGQRLLFRVLHAMSLHFPDTGYVQGMATLATTLLAYYEEERAFVMLVRLWDLRGLDELYKSGFGGLIQALDDFEKGWLGQGEVASKLVSSSALSREFC